MVGSHRRQPVWTGSCMRPMGSWFSRHLSCTCQTVPLVQRMHTSGSTVASVTARGRTVLHHASTSTVMHIWALHAAHNIMHRCITWQLAWLAGWLSCTHQHILLVDLDTAHTPDGQQEIHQVLLSPPTPLACQVALCIIDPIILLVQPEHTGTALTGAQ